MKIIRYQSSTGQIFRAAQQDDGTALRIEGDIFGDFRVSSEAADVAKILAPVAPAAIYGTGLNYRHHAIESNMPIPQFPVLFMKAPSSVCGPNDAIRLPSQMPSDSVDYECELAVVIGKSCLNATRENALDYVLGYTCANDVSARDWQIQKGGSQWCRGKTFDTFCPLGPALVTSDEIPDPNALQIKTVLNGQTVQNWNTSDMIFDVAQLIEFYSADTTLTPGTVILTGTPQGVGMAREPRLWLKDGDQITIEIEKIGALSNFVQGR